MNARHSIQTIIAKAAIAFLSLPLLSVQGADFEHKTKEWQLESGNDRNDFEKVLNDKKKKGMRIVDFEAFATGRSASLTTIWADKDKGEEWEVDHSMSITAFQEANEAWTKKGYSLVEIETDRLGATLQFAAVWVKRNEKPIKTIMHLGMNDLMFSNRYGEMSDRGYRLIDFESYLANGKDRMAAIWMPKNREDVRFYRGLDSKEFESVTEKLKKQSYRITDIEGYESSEGLRFAAAYIKLEKGQKAVHALNMLADGFYQKNADYQGQGLRMIDFDVYRINGDLRYMGTWVKDAPVVDTGLPDNPLMKDRASE